MRAETQTVQRAVEALPILRSAQFDLPLTYACAEQPLQVGDIVRVPFGKRETFAFVTRDPHQPPDDRPLRAVIEKAAAPAAFNAIGLALAKFIAEYYLCTLGEALSAIVLSSALPRTVDELVRIPNAPPLERYPSVPARFMRLLWHDLPERFALGTLLRHPEARRCGDRRTLLRYVRALVQGGALRRCRTFTDPRMHRYTVK
ncbi:MAG: hypothetical protein JO233_10110, partial [Candidatus Eremiobacteraeota bacterium]|nr:hypothetical protein [Candidatus Eremiobacteraeota bacterium]